MVLRVLRVLWVLRVHRDLVFDHVLPVTFIPPELGSNPTGDTVAGLERSSLLQPVIWIVP